MAAHSLSPTSITGSLYRRFAPQNLVTQRGRRSLWLGDISTNKFLPHSSNLGTFLAKPSSINATISLSLPTAKPDIVGGTKDIPKWSSQAIKSFQMAELEARKIKSPTTGTEALLMGILIEGTNFASKFLRANGITLLKVRDEVSKLRGKPEMFYFSPEHPPLTEAAQSALDWAIDKKLKSGVKEEITATHVLVGLWLQEESPGHQVMSALGFCHEKAEELEALISQPGFAEE